MLTKSKIIKGIKCKKALWLDVHKHEEADCEPESQGIFTDGLNIGVLARDFLPRGILALTDDYPNYRSAQRTEELIKNASDTIYEATFISNDVLVAIDILKKKDGKWQIYECKSSTSVKPEHIVDAAVQYFVVANRGLEVDDVFILHVNNGYIKNGEINPEKLFKATSIKEEVIARQEQIEAYINELKLVQLSSEPEIETGRFCHHPYPCSYWNYCCELIATIDDDKVEVETQHEERINKEIVKKRLEDFGYPLFFLDFETVMPAIPMFNESRPFQQIPFQYSLHYKETRDSHPEHYEYLAYPQGDPRKDLIVKLIKDLNRPGKILTYNVGFERTRLKELARDFPQYKQELGRIIDRLDDLMPIFRRKEYHERSMGRGYSIKLVLPLLAPELCYKELDISNGGDASAEFLKLYGLNDTDHITQTRQALLKYCCLDTLAMLRIVEELEKKCC